MSLAPVSGRIEHNSARIIKIISGGQTGVDRASLDVAIELGIKYGGYCPKGRQSEDGIIPLKYILSETETDDYLERTLKNVQCSDGTLILHKGEIIAGTRQTEKYCLLEKKRIIVVNKLNPIKQRIPGLAQTFARLDTSQIYLKPAIREMIESEDHSL
mgnify:CR=1 FL=1